MFCPLLVIIELLCEVSVLADLVESFFLCWVVVIESEFFEEVDPRAVRTDVGCRLWGVAESLEEGCFESFSLSSAEGLSLISAEMSKKLLYLGETCFEA